MDFQDHRQWTYVLKYSSGWNCSPNTCLLAGHRGHEPIYNKFSPLFVSKIWLAVYEALAKPVIQTSPWASNFSFIHSVIIFRTSNLLLFLLLAPIRRCEFHLSLFISFQKSAFYLTSYLIMRQTENFHHPGSLQANCIYFFNSESLAERHILSILMTVFIVSALKL